MIARNLTSPQNESETEEVAAWIAARGHEHGFRTPNVAERRRAMGMLAYLQTLGLNDQDMYDAQGNSFDPQAVCLRLQLGVQMWAAGSLERKHD